MTDRISVKKRKYSNFAEDNPEERQVLEIDKNKQAIEESKLDAFLSQKNEILQKTKNKKEMKIRFETKSLSR